MTAADHATAVQLVRSLVADHLTHLEAGERDELVERISAAIDRCARKRAAEELRELAGSLESRARLLRNDAAPLEDAALKARDRAEALTRYGEAL